MKPKHLLVLFVILALPPIIYVLYVTFAQNHYVRLPIFGDKKIVEVEGPEGPQIDTIYYQVNGLFEEIDAKSAKTDQLFRDHFTVLSLFASRNKDLTEQLYGQLLRVQDSFRDNELVQILSLVEKESLEGFLELEGRSSRWHHELVSRSSISRLERLLLSNEFCEGTEITNCHVFIILDHERRIRGYFKALQKRDVDDMMGALRVLRIEYYNENPVF